MTPEGKVKAKIKALLKLYGAYYHMPVQNGMGAPTLDFIGCHHGQFFAVEAKAPGKQPTARQHLTIETMHKAGARVWVISRDTELKALEDWLYGWTLR